jgi:hypothetical protein
MDLVDIVDAQADGEKRRCVNPLIKHNCDTVQDIVGWIQVQGDTFCVSSLGHPLFAGPPPLKSCTWYSM